MPVKNILSIIFGAVGLVFVILGAVFLMVQSQKNAYDGRGEAVVVGVRSKLNRNTKGMYYFPDMELWVNGKAYSLISHTGTMSNRYKVGDRVRVRYDSRNPSRFQIEGRNVIGTLGLVFLILGIVLLLIAAFCLIIL